jgi:predicted RNase H-like nuclease (RuvC/YqgF family)
MIKVVLGIDVSSTTTAFGVLTWDDVSNEIKYVKSLYIKPIKDGSIIERIVDTRDKVQKIIADIKPDYIAIEDIIAFMKGASTAQTVIILTTFNRMIGLVAYDYLGKAPQLCNVMSIRHGLKLNKQLPAKEEMPNLVAHHLSITFPYEYNKKGKIKVESYDKADGISVALYYAFLLSGKIKQKGKKK